MNRIFRYPAAPLHLPEKVPAETSPVFSRLCTGASRFAQFPMRLACLLLAGILFLASCGQENRVGNTEALTKEMKSMKIKRVTPNQLSGILYELGRKVAFNATNSFKTALQHGEKDSLCHSPETMHFFSSLRKNYGIGLRLVYAADTLLPGMDPKEKAILSAYAYNAAHGLPLSDNLQTLNDTLALYHSPLPADHPVFQKCPQAAESLFAVWHILFNTKEVIRKLDPKQLNP